jgi:hypothetical protein
VPSNVLAAAVVLRAFVLLYWSAKRDGSPTSWFVNMYANFWFQYYCYFVVHSFQQTIDEESASELIIDQSDEELTLGTTNSELDYKESERLVSCDSSFFFALNEYACSLITAWCITTGNFQSPHQSQDIIMLWSLMMWARYIVWFDFPYVD